MCNHWPVESQSSKPLNNHVFNQCRITTSIPLERNSRVAALTTVFLSRYSLVQPMLLCNLLRWQRVSADLPSYSSPQIARFKPNTPFPVNRPGIFTLHQYLIFSRSATSVCMSPREVQIAYAATQESCSMIHIADNHARRSSVSVMELSR
jgi:hypothetical protein